VLGTKEEFVIPPVSMLIEKLTWRPIPSLVSSVASCVPDGRSVDQMVSKHILMQRKSRFDAHHPRRRRHLATREIINGC
jgi:hypothetical protein